MTKTEALKWLNNPEIPDDATFWVSIDDTRVQEFYYHERSHRIFVMEE